MPLSKGNKQVPLSKKADHNNDSATIVGMAISVMVDQNELYGGLVDSHAAQVHLRYRGPKQFSSISSPPRRLLEDI